MRRLRYGLVSASPMHTAKRTIVLETRSAGDDHQVVSVRSPKKYYRKQPCSDCPWRVDAVGEFPAEAFRHSARTAYDLSEHVFACHQSGSEKPAACAGFLLRGADHKPKKVAIVACMRKLLIILNAMVRTGEPWKDAASKIQVDVDGDPIAAA